MWYYIAQQNINMKKILELSIIVNLCFITGIIVNYIPKINMNIYLFILINFLFYVILPIALIYKFVDIIGDIIKRKIDKN